MNVHNIISFGEKNVDQPQKIRNWVFPDCWQNINGCPLVFKYFLKRAVIKSYIIKMIVDTVRYFTPPTDN